MEPDICRFKIGDRVKTIHGSGVVKRIEFWARPGGVLHSADKQEGVLSGMHTYRYGVLHDTFPEKFKVPPRYLPKDNLFFYKREGQIDPEKPGD